MKATPAVIGAFLQRKTGESATNFTAGPVARKRGDTILIRHCAIMSGRVTAQARLTALALYKSLLVDAGVAVNDCVTDWGEPALCIEIKV